MLRGATLTGFDFWAHSASMAFSKPMLAENKSGKRLRTPLENTSSAAQKHQKPPNKNEKNKIRKKPLRFPIWWEKC